LTVSFYLESILKQKKDHLNFVIFNKFKLRLCAYFFSSLFCLIEQQKTLWLYELLEILQFELIIIFLIISVIFVALKP